MEKSKRRAFKLRVVKYFILEDHIYWKDPIGVLLICVDEAKSHEIMTEIHAGVCGGNLYWRDTENKILRVGDYWPTLFSCFFQSQELCRMSEICWKIEISTITSHSYFSRCSFPSMGSRLHR